MIDCALRDCQMPRPLELRRKIALKMPLKLLLSRMWMSSRSWRARWPVQLY